VNFDLTPEQQRWREVAREFARRVLGPGADAWDEAGEYPRGAFREAAALGLAGLFAPVEDGGQGLDGRTGGLILEQLAQGCFATTFGLVVHNNFARSLAGRAPTRPRSPRRPRRSGAATDSTASRPGSPTAAPRISTT
jgi:alkylation response protein AidB-like acyl-CoA dehydrogenase